VRLVKSVKHRFFSRQRLPLKGFDAAHLHSRVLANIILDEAWYVPCRAVET
jgi:hypothetical protein